LNTFVIKEVTNVLRKRTSKGRFSSKGSNERREGFMFIQLSECLSIQFGPPQLLLNLTTELMRFYPLFLKASIVLQRLMQ
jgi:hypothetical protein